MLMTIVDVFITLVITLIIGIIALSMIALFSAAILAIITFVKRWTKYFMSEEEEKNNFKA
jgi:hypothetical protein